MESRVIVKPYDNPIRLQRSDDGYFNATVLLNEFNELNSFKPKKLEDFKKLKETKELTEYLLVNNIAEKKAICTSLKGTWMHPFVFIDFAMWLSVEFKVKVLEWVYDGLITSRNDAGDYYKEMCTELLNQRNVLQKETSFFHYIQEAKMLKDLAGIDNRNEANETSLNMLNTLQKANIKLLKQGLAKEKRYSELLNLRNLIQ
jgi:hypothetical protein